MPRRFTLLDNVYYDTLCRVVEALEHAGASARDTGRALDLEAIRALIQGQPEAMTLLDEIAERLEDEEKDA